MACPAPGGEAPITGRYGSGAFSRMMGHLVPFGPHADPISGMVRNMAHTRL
jgi:hypothetical protein